MNRKYTGFLKAQIRDNVTSTSFLLSKQVTRPAPMEGMGKQTPPLDGKNLKVILQEV